jgi:hypothetical protein
MPLFNPDLGTITDGIGTTPDPYQLTSLLESPDVVVVVALA